MRVSMTAFVQSHIIFGTNNGSSPSIPMWNLTVGCQQKIYISLYRRKKRKENEDASYLRLREPRKERQEKGE